MGDQKATPAFHGKLRTADFYEAVNTTIRQHRRTATLREIAEKLNAKLLTTPSGLVWSRSRVANYLRNTGI